MSKLVLIFVGVPLIELAILVKMGDVMGFWDTIAIIFITGVIGAHLAHSQGLRVWIRIQEELNYGRVPAEELMDGILILIAGFVLITPGFLTDILGFIIVIPWTRNLMKMYLRKKFEQNIRGEKITIIRN